jgi:hypothetical protein
VHTTPGSVTQEGEILPERPSRRCYGNLNVVYTVRHVRINFIAQQLCAINAYWITYYSFFQRVSVFVTRCSESPMKL